jgi:GT2 family glycosyltransferase
MAGDREDIEYLPGWRVEHRISGALKTVSLVIATYRRPVEIVTLLDTLSKLPDQPGEVVIVDGSGDSASETGIRAWSGDRLLRFDLIYVTSPKGLTRQRNVGIDLCSGTYVVFLDDDCLPEPDYFRNVVGVFENDSERKIGAVSALVVNEMGQPVPRRWRIRLALGLVPRLAPRMYHASGTSVPRNTIPCFSGLRPIDILDGCAMAFRREVFSEHRFSEFFYGYSQGEDVEMSLRVRRRWQVVWCGDARVAHHHAAGGRPTSFVKGFMEIRNRHFIWKRHCPDAALLDRARFWLDAAFLIFMDVAWFMRRPRQPLFLSHAAGLACAALRCIFRPSQYSEPQVRVRYALSPMIGREIPKAS